MRGVLNQQIRQAHASDVPSILSMMQQSVDDAALIPRTRDQIQSRIKDFFVLELDGNAIGSVGVHTYEEDGRKIAEIACLFVRRSHKNKNHGRKLVAFAEVFRVPPAAPTLTGVSSITAVPATASFTTEPPFRLNAEESGWRAMTPHWL